MEIILFYILVDLAFTLTMQNLRQVRLAQRAQTSSVISLHRHLCDVPFFGRQAILFRIRSDGLATKTKFPTNCASDSPNSDPSKEDSKTKEGKINLAPCQQPWNISGHIGFFIDKDWYPIFRIARLITRNSWNKKRT